MTSSGPRDSTKSPVQALSAPVSAPQLLLHLTTACTAMGGAYPQGCQLDIREALTTKHCVCANARMLDGSERALLFFASADGCKAHLRAAGRCAAQAPALQELQHASLDDTAPEAPPVAGSRGAERSLSRFHFQPTLLRCSRVLPPTVHAAAAHSAAVCSTARRQHWRTSGLVRDCADAFRRAQCSAMQHTMLHKADMMCAACNHNKAGPCRRRVDGVPVPVPSHVRMGAVRWAVRELQACCQVPASESGRTAEWEAGRLQQLFQVGLWP